MAETNAKETKIVKAAPKKADSQQDEEPRVTVKAAVKTQVRTQQHGKPTRSQMSQAERPAHRPPMGKPVVNKELENRGKAPATRVGTPVVPKEVAERGKTPETQAERPVQETAAAAPGAAVPKTAVQTAEVKTPAAAETNHSEVKGTEYKEVEKIKDSTRPENGQRNAASADDSRRENAARPDRPQRQQNDRNNGSNRGERSDRSGRDGRTDRSGERQNRYGDRNGNRSDRNDRNDRGERRDRNNDRGGDRNFKSRGQGQGQGGNRNDRDNRNGSRNGGQGGQNGRGGASRQGRGNDRPALSKMETKPNQKNTEKRDHHEKERNKFAKLDKGGQGKKNKDRMQQRSLEKQSKPKKHNKPKPQVEEEEEDILEGLPTGTVAVTAPITVAGFCEQVGVSTSQVIMALMKMGIMANINQNIDEDTILILADELGISVVVAKVEEEEQEEGLELFEDKEEDLKPRAPIITVMGHVDHGKTSLLDAIRKTNVTASESGGITQHIGASEVMINGQKIVFLDTPGHEAFTAMRARGAHITDIAILVVAADDGVMPQTIESISHAKAAGVPIIVAINKIDKPGANPDRVKQELTEHGILVEDWGGDVISVPVSAKSGEGIMNLLEMVLLQAEVMELKANPNRLAMGSVIEARLDKNKGPVATLLVTNGTLKTGMSIVAGTCAGRIRLMTDFKGREIKKAGPATAVEVLGLSDVPEAGDEFNAVKQDKLAKEIAENRKQKLREEVLARNASTTLEQLFSQIQEGEVKDLNLIIKGDVQGSIGAIVSSLEKLNNENVRVKIIHTGVGTVTESDVMLAGTTGSIIIGFNVRPTTAVQTFADRENIQIRLYRVIYDILNDVEDAMKGMLDPEFKEEVLGKAEVRNTF